MYVLIYLYIYYLFNYILIYVYNYFYVCVRVSYVHTISSWIFWAFCDCRFLKRAESWRISEKKGHQIQLEVRKSKLPAAWHLAHSWFNSIRTRTHKNIHVQSSTVMCSLQKGKGRCYLLPSWGAHVAKMYWSSQRLLHVTVGQYTQTLHWRERWT